MNNLCIYCTAESASIPVLAWWTKYFWLESFFKTEPEYQTVFHQGGIIFVSAYNLKIFSINFETVELVVNWKGPYHNIWREFVHFHSWVKYELRSIHFSFICCEKKCNKKIPGKVCEYSNVLHNWAELLLLLSRTVQLNQRAKDEY